MTQFDHIRLIWGREMIAIGDAITFLDGLPPPTQQQLDDTREDALALFERETTNPVPKSITRLQRNLWLGQARYSALTAWINALPVEQKFEATIFWKDADITERNHPLTIAMGQVLGLNSEQMDQAFREASLL